MSKKSKAMEEHIIVPGESKQETIKVANISDPFKQDFSIIFHDVNKNNERIGALTTKDGKVVFVGNVDESAKQLFNQVIIYDQYIKELNEKIKKQSDEIQSLKKNNKND